MEQAMYKVFHTMLSKDIQMSAHYQFPNEDHIHPPSPVIDTENIIVTGSAGFTGRANGVVYISMDEPTAEVLSGALLGLSHEEIKEEGTETVNDALGELTNMCVGDFKNQICDKGFDCTLTLPSILRGEHVKIESPAGDEIRRYMHQFLTDQLPVIVDVILKPTE